MSVLRTNQGFRSFEHFCSSNKKGKPDSQRFTGAFGIISKISLAYTDNLTIFINPSLRSTAADISGECLSGVVFGFWFENVV